MPLIEAGDYNVTYNQEYLLKKLYNIDIVWSYAALICLIIFIICICVYAFLSLRERRIKFYEDKKDTDNNIQSNNFNRIICEFVTIAKSLEEMKSIHCIPETELKKTNDYLHYLVKEALPNEKYIFKYDHETISYWFKYKYIVNEKKDEKK